MFILFGYIFLFKTVVLKTKNEFGNCHYFPRKPKIQRAVPTRGTLVLFICNSFLLIVP